MIGVVVRWVRQMLTGNRAALLKALALFAGLSVLGSIGFKIFEGAHRPTLTWGDAIWWAIVTMTTVGYGDFFPTTAAGRYLVAMPLMVVGIGNLGYLLSVLAVALIESRSKELRGMAEVHSTDHVIVVHFRSLQSVMEVVQELKQDSKTKRCDVVLVDEHLNELPSELANLGVRFVRGNPSKESTLRRARVDTAKFAIVLSNGVSASSADDHTLAVVLTIEALNPNVATVAECVDPERIELMRRTGCNGVVCVASLSSALLVQEVADPGTQAVVKELTSNTFGQQVYIAAIKKMRTWQFAELRSHLSARGYLVMGLQRGNDARLNPGDACRVEPNDRVICVGSQRPDPVCIEG